MKKKVLLLNPPLSLEERYGSLAEGGSSAPPIGLCNLGSVLLNKYDVKIIDSAALGLDFEQTLESIEKYNPDYLGITAVTVSIYNSAKITTMFKEKHPEIKTILGGPHITAIPEETMNRFSQFDIGVIGEGEDTIVELLQFLEKGRKLLNVDGIIFRDKKGKNIKTKPRKFIINLDKLPFPAWHLLPDLGKYYRPPIFSVKAFPSTSLITSRGCNGKCTFCDRKVFGNICRSFSAEYVNKMILKLMKDYRIRDIVFSDDNFVLFKPRLKKLCEIMINENYDLSWSCNARVDLIDKETLKLMKQAGCWQIAYGVETGSQKILDVLKKNITLKEIRKTITNTKNIGIEPKGFFMIGHPLETKETIRETIDFAKSLPLEEFQITQFTPLPGSEIYNTAEKYGTLERDWKKMNMWDIVFVPNGLTKKDLKEYSKKAFKEFYLRPHIVFSFIKKINSFNYFLGILKGFKAFVFHVFFKKDKS